jgi:two-component system sensor histidine kinase QseC
MKQATLALKLFIRLVPTILITIAFSCILAGYSARREIDRNYDAQLINNASVLWMLVQEELMEDDGFSPRQFSGHFKNSQFGNKEAGDYADGRMFRIWKSGHIIMWSDTALDETIPPLSEGFTDMTYKDKSWRIYTLALRRQQISIEVGERPSLRKKFERHILLDVLLPLLLFIPLSGILLWLGINSGLAGIRLLIRQIQQRSPDDLMPLDTNALTRDLAPLGQSINTLLSKLGHSLNAERRFADNAAHQLRTPLAGLKLQLQTLQQADAEEQPEMLRDIIANADRAASLVGLLLTAARVVHQPLQVAGLNLYDLVASTIAGVGQIIRQKNIDVALEGEEEAVVLTDGTLLSIMLANIVENAVKFTPVGGSIKGSIRRDGPDWLVEMTDNGPGIPEQQWENVFKKFSRADNAVEDGTGLGLSIVADIALRLEAKVALLTPESGEGLTVQVWLRAAF